MGGSPLNSGNGPGSSPFCHVVILGGTLSPLAHPCQIIAVGIRLAGVIDLVGLRHGGHGIDQTFVTA